MAIQYFAEPGDGGRIVAFYNTDIWELNNIPPSAVAITQEQWTDAIENPSKYIIKNREMVPAPPIPESKRLKQAKAAKIAELDSACNAAILAGFASSALGEEHNYDFDYEAQTNLSGYLNAISAGIVPEDSIKDWKTLDAGPLPHTVEQFKQVYADGLMHKDTLISTFWVKKAEVQAAATEAAVAKIAW